MFMKPFICDGLLVHLELSEEPAGVWWPNATIEDPETGERARVSLPTHQRSWEAGVIEVVKEARRRIRAGTWRN